MNTPISKSHLREALGFSTDAEVAAFFDISASAVSQWADDNPIPRLRQLEAIQKRPDLFGATAGDRQAARRSAAAPGGDAAATAGIPTQPMSEAA